MSVERSRREVLLALALGAGHPERRLLPDQRSGIDRRTVDAQVDVERRLGVERRSGRRRKGDTAGGGLLQRVRARLR